VHQAFLPGHFDFWPQIVHNDHSEVNAEGSIVRGCRNWFDAPLQLVTLLKRFLPNRFLLRDHLAGVLVRCGRHHRPLQFRSSPHDEIHDENWCSSCCPA